ncbi:MULTISPECIES: hypothetical protein [unclassified Ensifer]|uniref:hypothetical protein n=1 Tax=unclassified Ensifer TaxID=2633371 RepID=UPI000812F74E|nr:MULTISPECIES: hypothetical protein [unclassified Ensifer]OCP17705.1 hypothetical protein BC361_09760 [Ensifer sp. LC54]OCP28388.1 hypothetical protein BC363_00600 [Ensifer sp. LC384]OCP38736.1 hypothetical protein BC360_01380 [Ensifer sp. LC163]
MAELAHPKAIEHLPVFITAPGETDLLFNFVVIFLVVAIFAVGTFYLRLHSLPETLAHKSHKTQYELVAVLGLISLFTHNNIFWIAALILALIDLPDFSSPLSSISRSLERIAGKVDQSTMAEPGGMATDPVASEPKASASQSSPDQSSPVQSVEGRA